MIHGKQFIVQDRGASAVRLEFEEASETVSTQAVGTGDTSRTARVVLGNLRKFNTLQELFSTGYRLAQIVQ